MLWHTFKAIVRTRNILVFQIRKHFWNERLKDKELSVIGWGDTEYFRDNRNDFWMVQR